MTRQRVIANDWEYTVSPDDPIAESEQLWALVTGRVIDEVTGVAPRRSIRITIAEFGLTTRGDGDGAMCIIARPWLHFPPLHAETYNMHITVEADGYLPLTREVLIPCNWRRLIADALVNSNTLNLDSVDGLFAGQIVLIGPAGEQAERHRIAQVNHATNIVTLSASLRYDHLLAPVPPGALPCVVPDAFTSVNHVLIAVDVSLTTLTLDSTIGLYVGQILRVGANVPTTITAIVSANQVTVAPPLSPPTGAGDPVVSDPVIPVQLGDIALRRRPVVIRGRTVVRTNTGTTHVANATVAISGIWRSLDDIRHHLPAMPATIVISITPGLYDPKAPGTDLDEIPLTDIVGDDKTLLKPVESKETQMALSDGINVVAGTSVVAIDPEDSERRERLLVSALESTLTASDPVNVTVNYPLRKEHAWGCRVAHVTPGAPASTTKHLTEQTAPGDQTLFLDDIAFAADTGVARVGGAASVEFQQFARYQVTSDADGYFALPPLHRIAQIEIEASAAGHQAINAANNNTILLQPDYTKPENWLDVMFKS